jgi:hypothetical protein
LGLELPRIILCRVKVSKDETQRVFGQLIEKQVTSHALRRSRRISWNPALICGQSARAAGLAGGADCAGRDAPQTAWRKMRQPP